MGARGCRRRGGWQFGEGRAEGGCGDGEDAVVGEGDGGDGSSGEGRVSRSRVLSRESNEFPVYLTRRHWAVSSRPSHGDHEANDSGACPGQGQMQVQRAVVLC